MLRAVVVVLVSLLWDSVRAQAGYYLEQELVVPNPVTFQPIRSTVRSWHEGKRSKREDPARNEMVVLDLETRTVIGLNSSARTYWKLPAERYRQLALASLVVLGVRPQADGTLEVPETLFVPTGLKATVAGREATQVKVKGSLPPGIETELWLSESVPLTTETIVIDLRLALGDPQHPSFERFFAQWRSLKGYPIQTVTTVTTPKGRVVTSETLLRFVPQTIDPSEFDVPAGYTLTEDPITQKERVMQNQIGPIGIDAPLRKSTMARPAPARSP
jgi:hypothetical protein